MSQREHPVLRGLYEFGLNSGEVTEVSPAGVTVAVAVSPGDEAIKYAPGSRVFVLTEYDAIELMGGVF